jgi:hypothetical protein
MSLDRRLGKDMRALASLLESSSRWSAKRSPAHAESRRLETIERYRTVLAEIAANKNSSSTLSLDLPKTVREVIEAWETASGRQQTA